VTGSWPLCRALKSRSRWSANAFASGSMQCDRPRSCREEPRAVPRLRNHNRRSGVFSASNQSAEWASRVRPERVSRVLGSIVVPTMQQQNHVRGDRFSTAVENLTRLCCQLSRESSLHTESSLCNCVPEGRQLQVCVADRLKTNANLTVLLGDPLGRSVAFGLLAIGNGCQT